MQRKVEALLSTTAEIKVDQIAAWRRDQLEDALLMQTHPFLLDNVAAFIADPEGSPRRDLLIRFRNLANQHDYADILLVDPSGEPLLHLSGERPSSRGYAEGLAEALRTRRPAIVDIHVDEKGEAPHLSVVAPLYRDDTDDGASLGALVFVNDAQDFLYPTLRYWPLPSETAETLMVRREGEEVLFLNDLHFQPESALAFRLPLSRTQTPAVMAVLGRQGYVEGRDYRDVPVAAYVLPIPDSPWYLVTKIATAEAFAAWRLQSALLLGLLLGLVASIALAGLTLLQRREKAHYRALYESEAQLRANVERHSVTLKAIGDAVIATDAEGRVELLNPVAEALTGWTQDEARGRPLAEVFRIIQEETRQTVESPVVQVLREGLVVGLANHTLLIARDGSERPIADSGAPIRDGQGTITGVVLVFRDQTAERLAQETLRQSEERYRSLFEGSHAAMLLIDPATGRFLDVNPAAARFYGWSREELKQMTLAAISALPPESAEQHLKAAQESRRNRIECAHRLADGSVRDVEVYSGHIRYEQREVLYAIVHDITLRRQAEEAVRASEQRFRMFAELAPVGIVIADRKERGLYISPKFVEIFGYNASDVPSVEAWWPLAYPDPALRAQVQRVWNDALAAAQETGRDALPMEFPVTCKNGQVRQIEFRVTTTGDLNLIVFADVTDRRKAELALRERIKELRCLYNITELLYRTGGLLDALLTEAVHLLPPGWQYPEAAAASITVRERRFQTENFQETPWRQSAPIPSPGGPVGEVTVVYLEEQPAADEGPFLTEERQLLDEIARRLGEAVERMRAAEALHASEEFQRALIACSPVALYSVDQTGAVLSWNESAERIFGWTAGEVIGRPLPIVPEGSREEFEELRRQILSGEGSLSHERLCRRKDGGLAPVSLSVAPVRDSRGAVVALLAAAEDLTARKRAEAEQQRLQEQMTQMQRLESVGRLAGGVAHDFNNILQAMLGYSSMLLDRLPEGDESHEYAHEIAEGVRRATALTRQLLAFARKQIIAPRVVNLNGVIENMLKMIRRLIGEDIQLAWLPGDELWPVLVDPGQMDQILANLCVNARDAIRGVGQLTIETGNVSFDDAYCGEHPGSLPGEFVLLAVSDDGCGIDPETREKIFEPFFTTKDLGEGVGLGLATVYGIVKQNNGFINVYSEPGKGTTFRLYLPRHTGEAETAPAPESAPTAAGRGERILMVEDEPAILSLGKRMLEGLGYQVLTAGAPSRALEIAREENCNVQLLITDVVMPEMNGRDLSERLRAECPGIRTLFMSGYTSNVIAHRGVLEDGVHFMQKPFSLAELAAKVRQALER